MSDAFEAWLRSVCIAKPPPDAYDLALCAWQEGVKQGREQITAEARAWLEGVGACTGAKYVGGGTVELTFTKDAAPSTLAPHP